MSTISNLDVLLVDEIQNKANDGPPTIAGLETGGGWPLEVSVSDLSDDEVICAALVAALGLALSADGWSAEIYVLSHEKDDVGYYLIYIDGGVWLVDTSVWYGGSTPTGAGNVYIFRCDISVP